MSSPGAVRTDNVDEGVWDEDMEELRESIVRWTGNECQVYELSESDLERHVAAEEPVVAEWRRDAVHLAQRVPPLRDPG